MHTDLSRTKSETLIAECTAHASINADRENTVNVVLPTQEIVMLTDNAEKTTSPTKSMYHHVSTHIEQYEFHYL